MKPHNPHLPRLVEWVCFGFRGCEEPHHCSSAWTPHTAVCHSCLKVYILMRLSYPRVVLKIEMLHFLCISYIFRCYSVLFLSSVMILWSICGCCLLSFPREKNLLQQQYNVNLININNCFDLCVCVCVIILLCHEPLK